MDRTLLSIRSALTDTRVMIAHQFQKMTQVISKNEFAVFLIIYCRQAAALCQGMTGWNEKMRQKITDHETDELMDTLAQVSHQLACRYQALTQDIAAIAQWVEQHLGGGLDAKNEKLVVSSGMKQLRFISQECIKYDSPLGWLLMMTEIERLRIVHGFTLIKLCELYFGKSILRCFSHIHYQHQNQNELFSLCENAVNSQIKLHTVSIQSMIHNIKTAIDAYAHFIDDCYNVSLQRVAQDVKSTPK